MSRAPSANAAAASALSGDARLGPAMAAAHAERANRPTYLLIGAALLLLVTTAALLWSWQAKASSESRLDAELALGQQFVEAAKQLGDLDATPRSGPSANDPIADMNSRMQAAANRAGMLKETTAKLIAAPGRDNTRSGNAVRKRFQYTNVHEPTLAPLVNWLTTAAEDIPGLRVYSLTIKPDPTGWNMSVTFTRWERSAP